MTEDFFMNSQASSFDMRKSLWKLQRRKHLTDTILEVNGVEYHCHRIILAIQEGYFSTILKSGFVEEKLPRFEVRLPDPMNLFGKVLKYMYTGDTKFLNSRNAMAVIAIAWYLQLKPLQKCAEKAFPIDFSSDSLNEVLYQMKSAFIPSLPPAIASYIAKNFYNCLNNQEIYSFSQRYIMNIIGNKDIKIENERQLINFLSTYAKINQLEILQDFSKYIHWQMLTPSEWNLIPWNDFMKENKQKQHLNNYINITKGYENIGPIIIAMNTSTHTKMKSYLLRYEPPIVHFFNESDDFFNYSVKFHYNAIKFPKDDVITKSNSQIQLGFKPKYAGSFQTLNIHLDKPGMNLITVSMTLINNDEKIIRMKQNPQSKEFFSASINERLPFIGLSIFFDVNDKQSYKLIALTANGFWFSYN